MRLLLLLAAAAPLVAQTCHYAVSPDPAQTITVPATASSSTVTVTAEQGCGWSYRTDAPSLIAFTGGPKNGLGNGSGSFTFNVAANTVPDSPLRTAKILIFLSSPAIGSGTVVLTIMQAPPACSLNLSSKAASFGVSGGSGTFGVTTNCNWNAVPAVSWISVAVPSYGSASGAVNYTVQANNCVETRAASIVVVQSPPNPTLDITQEGAPGNLSLSPASADIPAAAFDGRIAVSTGAACGWTAISDVSWLHINRGSAGTGGAAVSYHADANPGTAVRAGHVLFGSLVFTLTQQGLAAAAMQLNAVDSSASGVVGPIAPGEIVTLWGANVGPVGGVGLQLAADGSVSKRLAGVEVLFDDVPAALAYVSEKQINAVAPYAIKGGTGVQVRYSGAVSNTLTVAVDDAAPGIYTQDGSGHGGGAVLNADMSLNGNASPAARGSVVAIYMTGAGATTPPLADGAVTPSVEPLPRVALPVTVTIGGIPSPKIWYSGGAPGAVAGVTQINAEIPAGVASGANLLVVSIGGRQSQERVTVSVK